MRRGFVLITVLWVLVGASAVALGALLVARDAVALTRNRRALDRAMWIAEGCVASVRSLLDSVLDHAGAWGRLDSVVGGRVFGDCQISLQSAGARLDINQASEVDLAHLLDRMSVAPARRDSLVAALLDWRDEDDAPRARGAERDYYAAAGGFEPRNGPFQAIAELRRVRGIDEVPSLDSVLDVEPGRIDLNHASLTVVSSLPGITDDALAQLASLRVRGERLDNVLAIPSRLVGLARDSLLSHFAEFVDRATVEPEAWILTARAPKDAIALTFSIELRLLAAGSRAAVVRRREW